MLLFLLASGLTLIFSMMGVLNFAHASFFMLGAYFAYQIADHIGFWRGLIAAPILVGVFGVLDIMINFLHSIEHSLNIGLNFAPMTTLE